MKTISINLYSFNELSKESQQKALKALQTINVEFNWWGYIYDDAENIGLKITSFDLDRNRNAQGYFTKTSEEVALEIQRQHGEECQTYKIATEFSTKLYILKGKLSTNIDTDIVSELEGAIYDLSQSFREDLLSEYANMLQKDCDYRMSDEAIIETINANEYTFEQDGTLRNA